MSESKEQEKKIQIKYKPISMAKVFGKDRKQFSLQLPINSNANQIINAFLQIDEVDQIFNILQKIGGKVDLLKINFIMGGKKINIETPNLDQIILSDTLGDKKESVGQINILITSSQVFGDKDIARISGKGENKVEKKQQQTGFIDIKSSSSSYGGSSLQLKAKNVKIQTLVDRSLLAKLRNMNYSEQMSLIAVNEVKKNHEGKKQPNIDQALNQALDFIQYLQNNDMRKAKELSEYQQSKKIKLGTLEQKRPMKIQQQQYDYSPAPVLTKYDIQTLNISTNKNSSSTFSWGNNYDGQLGINSSMLCSLAPHPVFELADTKIKSIVCGGTLTLFLTQNGQVLHCGKYFYPDPKLPTQQQKPPAQNNKNNQNQGDDNDDDDEGEGLNQMDRMRNQFMRMMRRGMQGPLLQNNNQPNRFGGQFRQLGGGFQYLPGSKDISKDPKREYGRNIQPKPIIFQERNFITKISAGVDHCLAIDSNGNIFSWGNGINGQLGHGFKNNQLYPRLIQSVQKIFFVDIAAGAEHSVALTFNGDLLGWGSNNFDQLGNQFVTQSLKPQLMIINLEDEKEDEKKDDDEEDEDNQQQQQQSDEEESKIAEQSQTNNRINFRTYVRALRDEQQKQELKGQKVVLNSLKVSKIKCSSWSCTAVIEDQSSPHSTPHRLITWGNSYVKKKDITNIISDQFPARIPIQFSLKGDSGIFITKNNELARYDYSQGKVIERLTSTDKIVNVSAGSDFFSVKTSEGYLLQKGKNKSGQLGNGNTQSKQQLLSHSLSIGGDTVELFDSGFRHTVIVYDNQTTRLRFDKIAEDQQLKSNQIRVKDSDGNSYKINKILAAYLFQNFTDCVEIGLSDAALDLLVHIIEQIRQQRSIYSLILNNSKLKIDDLDAILKFLNSFTGRKVFRSNVANLLSQSVEQMIKMLHQRQQNIKVFYSASEKQIVKAKLNYINFIHKANQQLRQQRRNQRIRRQEEERKQRAAAQNNNNNDDPVNRLRQLEQRGLNFPLANRQVQGCFNSVDDYNNRQGLGRLNNQGMIPELDGQHDDQDDDDDQNDNQQNEQNDSSDDDQDADGDDDNNNQQAARQRYMQARNQYHQIVQRRAQQQQQQLQRGRGRGRGNQLLGRGGLGIQRGGGFGLGMRRGRGRGAAVDLLGGRGFPFMMNQGQPRGVQAMRYGRPVQLNNEQDPNYDQQQAKNQPFSGTGVSLSGPTPQQNQQAQQQKKEVQSPEDLRQKRLNLFKKQQQK